MSWSTTEIVLMGATAGLAVAMTPGAMTALLVDLAARGGVRPALAAGLGVATVDGAYAFAAAWGGAGLSVLLAPVEGVAKIAAAAILVAVAVRGLLRLRRAATPAAEVPGRRRSYLTFAGLTAVNPTTIAVFTAFVTGVAHTVAATPGARAAFAAGVLGASAGWHALLAVGGGLFGRLPARAGVALTIACQALVLALAARMVAGA